MNVAVDIEPFYRNRAGVGRYVEGLLGALTRLPEADDYTLFRSSTYASAESVPGLVRERVRDVTLPMSHKACRLRWLLLGRPRVERYVGSQDLFFSPGVSAFPTRGRLVVVLFDLVWLKFPHFYPRRSVWLRGLDLRRVVKRATAIVTISEASRRDILEATGFDEDRVSAVPLGIDPRLQTVPSTQEVSQALDALGVRRPYVLAIAGDNSPKKNLPNLVRALAALPTEMRDVRLVNVGNPRYDTAALDRVIAECGVGDRVQSVGRVSDEELRMLYAGARVTAYPSFYEGFGFPIVESMTLGTPVVTSNTSSMPEVAGDAALLVAPDDVAGLSQAIASLVGDDALHTSLAAKGRERAKQFTWERCARETRDVFAGLVET